MVDFTKPVNNADMVKCLNALIRSNKDLSVYYEDDLIAKTKDSPSAKCLKSLHENHAELLADTVRLLGGAPDSAGGRHQSVGGHWLKKLLPDSSALDEVKKAEEKLQGQYLEALQEQAVRASPECVAVINQVLEESRQALQAVMGSEKV